MMVGHSGYGVDDLRASTTSAHRDERERTLIQLTA
jgi:hypothetical protein